MHFVKRPLCEAFVFLCLPFFSVGNAGHQRQPSLLAIRWIPLFGAGFPCLPVGPRIKDQHFFVDQGLFIVFNPIGSLGSERNSSAL